MGRFPLCLPCCPDGRLPPYGLSIILLSVSACFTAVPWGYVSFGAPFMNSEDNLSYVASRGRAAACAGCD